MIDFLKATFDVKVNLHTLADVAILLHSLVTLLAVGWALLVDAGLLGLLIVALWALAGVVWLEFKHSDDASGWEDEA